MYTAFFGLREKPFALSPDPRFLYLSEAHREALAHLIYGIEQGEGFIAVTGEVGTGKTTLCRTLLRRLGGEVEVAFLFNPKLSARELLESVLVELGVEANGHAHGEGRKRHADSSVRELIEALNQFLLEKRAAGKRVLLIVDEAQGLLPETLEQIRLLSNLETESDKLIQILLLGQPELDVMLESPDLRQLRQRIGVRWRLAPLSRDEVASYVRHRLSVSAGVARDHVFSDAALSAVYRFSGGVPRLVNLVCDRALLAAYGEGAAQIGPDYVRRASAEISGDAAPAPSPRWLVPALAAGLLAALAGAVIALGGPRESLRRVATWLGVEPSLTVVVSPETNVTPMPAAENASIEATATATPDVSAPPPSTVVAAPPTPAAPVEPAPPPAPPRIDDLGRALAQRAPAATLAASQAALFQAWSIAPSGADPISFAELVGALAEHDLGVFSISSPDLEPIRALGHPVLLDVEAADGVPRLVALRSIGDGEVELDGVVAEGAVRVGIDELMRVWLGDAHLVWRDFEALPEILRPGDDGEGVEWLQRSLVEVGLLRGEPTGYFDSGTEIAVKNFQLEHGLEDDGAVGPLTKMALYRALGRYAVPHLAAATPAGDAG
jgi:general secretion pathway protein A